MVEAGTRWRWNLWKDTRGLSTTEYVVLLLVAVVTGMLAWSLFSDSTGESTDEAGVAIRTMEGQAGNLSAQNWTGPATHSSVLGETGNTTFAGQTIGAGPSSNSAPSIKLGPATRINAPTREYQPSSRLVLVADESPEEPVTRTLPPAINLVDANGNPTTLSDSSAPEADSAKTPILVLEEFTYYTINSPSDLDVVDFSDLNSVYQNDNHGLFQEQTGFGPVMYLPEPPPAEPSFARQVWDLYWEEQMQSNPIQTLALQGMWEAARDGTVDTVNSIHWAANNKGKVGLNVLKAGLWLGMTPSEVKTDQVLNATGKFIADEANHVTDLTINALSGDEESFENLIKYYGGASYTGLTFAITLDPSDVALAGTLASFRAARRGAVLLTKVDNVDAPTITQGDAPTSRVDESNPSNLDENGNVCRKDQCFAAGTLVQTEGGPKPIEEIHVGDFVLARHEHTFELGYFEVLDAFSRDAPRVFRLMVQSEERQDEIIVTQEHPFFTKDGWTPAEKLQPGNQIITADERTSTVLSLQTLSETTTVYNLTVQDAHTYFVGQTQMWVHNTCECDGDEDTLDSEHSDPDLDDTEDLRRARLSPEEIPDLVFRGTKSEPSIKLEQGFIPRGENTNSYWYVHGGISDGAFVSTSFDPDVARSFSILRGKGDGYLYVIQPSKEIPSYDINRAFPGAESSWEKEIAIRGPVPPEQIVGYWKVDGTTNQPIGDFVPNENFLPQPGTQTPQIQDFDSLQEEINDLRANTEPSPPENSSAEIVNDAACASTRCGPITFEKDYQRLEFDLQVARSVPREHAPWYNTIPASTEESLGLLGYVDPKTKQIVVRPGKMDEFQEIKNGETIIGPDGKTVESSPAIFAVEHHNFPITDYARIVYAGQPTKEVQENLERTLSNQLGIDIVLQGDLVKTDGIEWGNQIVRRTPYGDESIEPPKGITSPRYEDNTRVLQRALVSPNEMPALVFRGTVSPPSKKHQEGFAPRGDNRDLSLHARWVEDSAFVSTSESPWSASRFPNSLQLNQERWVYVIQPPIDRSIYDVNRVFPNGLTLEREFAVEGAISDEHLVGAWRGDRRRATPYRYHCSRIKISASSSFSRSGSSRRSLCAKAS